jgi:hypothetical protein
MNTKHYWAIRNLPNNPAKPILWIVYNEDMVEYTRNLISEIKGEDYMEHIKVVARTEAYKESGTVYFDPLLMDHISNGSA